MITVTFGDLAGPARRHLAVAARFEGETSAVSLVAAARALARIARTLSRYLADTVPYGVMEALTSPSLEDWVRAAVDARQVLRTAATTLYRAAASVEASRVTLGANPDPAVPGGGMVTEGAGLVAEPVVAHLRAAGAGLAAARDVLRTHFVAGIDGEQVESSQWAAVVGSAPVTRAVLEEVSRWSRELAFLAARLSLVSPPDAAVPIAVQHDLASSCHWLLTAGGALSVGQGVGPPTPDDARLLDAIPANIIAARRPPGEGEPDAALARGVAATAARLRIITRSAPGRAAWSPAMTADSWRWTAAAAAAICHISEQALGVLAAHPELGAALPGVGSRLAAAAGDVGRARERWRDVAQAWQLVVTDTKGLTAPGLADIADLAVRLGRIAFRGSAWMPGQDTGVPLRAPAELAPNADGFTAIVSTVHHAADALACVGAADRHAVGLAIRANRLHVPTRTLPSEYDVPYKFGPALPATAAALRDAYDGACEATVGAVAAMDALAVAVDAPSRGLAHARAAGRPPTIALPVPENSERPDRTDQPRGRQPEPSPDRPPGPLELEVRKFNPADPVILLRARAIDKAASDVVREARASSRSRQPADGRNGAPSAPAPVRTAAVNFPQATASASRSAGRNHAQPVLRRDQAVPAVRASRARQ